MFWGLIMEPRRRYTQVVKKPFHLSMAALDITSSDGEPAQVMLGCDNRNYLLCTLQEGSTIQCPLDLNFEVGDAVAFATNGNSHVHLTGYLLEEDDFNDESSTEEEAQENTSTKKRKHITDNTLKSFLKKSKTESLLDEVEDESDDSDLNYSDIVGQPEEASDEEGEEEDGDEESDDEEDDDSDESSLSDEEQEEKQDKPKLNGLSATKEEKKKLLDSGKKQNVASGKKLKQEAKILQTPKDNKTSIKEEKTPNKSVNQKTPKGDTGNKTPGQESPKKRTVEGGVVIEDLRVGDGQVAKAGKLVQVHYEGRLKQNNKMFDSSKAPGPGFKFRLGRKEVIKGWDVGVAGMKIGGKRRIICPPNMAYGAKGSPPTIPPNSTLVFDVELKNIL